MKQKKLDSCAVAQQYKAISSLHGDIFSINFLFDNYPQVKYMPRAYKKEIKQAIKNLKSLKCTQEDKPYENKRR